MTQDFSGTLILETSQDPAVHTAGCAFSRMRVQTLTENHRGGFEHCVQRTLEIRHVIWKGGESSPQRHGVGEGATSPGLGACSTPLFCSPSPWLAFPGAPFLRTALFTGQLSGGWAGRKKAVGWLLEQGGRSTQENADCGALRVVRLVTWEAAHMVALRVNMTPSQVSLLVLEPKTFRG